MPAATEIPQALGDATEHQPGARAALAAALAAPVHAYLLAGPPGSGKRSAARAFAAELLAQALPTPTTPAAARWPTRRRTPTWSGCASRDPAPRRRGSRARDHRFRLSPIRGRAPGVRDRGRRRDGDESQNALLKTLEEPADFVHLLLISAEPELLLETVRSRCQIVRFRPLTEEAVVAGLEERVLGDGDDERRAAARLAGGDPRRAEYLVSDEGRELRAVAADCAAVALSGELADAPWRRLVATAEATGAGAGEETVARLAALAAEAGETEGRAARRAAREAEEAGKRASRRARTEALDAGLGLLAAWLRDMAAVAEGAEELALNADRIEELREAASGLDARAARRGAELVMDTRRRLTVNVGEELALEALVFRLEALLSNARNRP